MRWAEFTLEVTPDAIEPAIACLTEAGLPGVVVYDPGAVSSDPFADWIVQDQDPTAPPSAARRCRVQG